MTNIKRTSRLYIFVLAACMILMLGACSASDSPFIKKKTVEDYYQTAQTAYESGDSQKVRSTISEAREASLDSGWFYCMDGMLYFQAEDYVKALQCFEEGISYTDGEESEARRMLLRNQAITLAYLEKYEDAYEKLQDYSEKYSMDDELQKEMDFLSTRQQ